MHASICVCIGVCLYMCECVCMSVWHYSDKELDGRVFNLKKPFPERSSCSEWAAQIQVESLFLLFFFLKKKKEREYETGREVKRDLGGVEVAMIKTHSVKFPKNKNTY